MPVFRPKNEVVSNLVNLAKESQNPALTMAMMDLSGSLKKIAERAIALGDEVLLQECEHLCLVQEKVTE